MTSKAKRRRAKKARKATNLPALAPIAPRKQGRRVTWDNAANEYFDADPQKTAQEARCRQIGVEATEKAKSAVLGQHSGDPLGWVLDYQCAPEERRKLWGTFAAYCASHATYERLVLGKTPHAKGAAIAMVPDRMEADTGHTVDLRDLDQRIADAKASRARWDGYLAKLPGAYIHALAFARLDQGPQMWREKAPTRYGLVTLKALRALHEVVG